MWLFNSSVGKKVIMSVSGIALVLFLLFHMSMNLVAIFSAEGYNMICEFLGANWYALIATAGLAALVVVHFVYAIILTLQNKKARGGQGYAYTVKPKTVEWASQNMFVLGVIVILGMALHLFNFWANMQLVEVLHMLGANVDASLAADGVHYIKGMVGKVSPENGKLMVRASDLIEGKQMIIDADLVVLAAAIEPLAISSL